MTKPAEQTSPYERKIAAPKTSKKQAPPTHMGRSGDRGSGEDDDALDIHLGTARVAQRYSVDRRTVDRWWADPGYIKLGFPKPDLRINGRKLWRLSSLQAWERRRAKALAA